LKKKIYNSKTRKNRKFLRRSTVKRNKIGGAKSKKSTKKQDVNYNEPDVNNNGMAFNTRSKIKITDTDIEKITNPVKVSIYVALNEVLSDNSLNFTKTSDSNSNYITHNITIEKSEYGALARPHIHYKDNVFCGFPTGKQDKITGEITTYKIAVDKLSEWKKTVLDGNYEISLKKDWLELIGEIRNNIFQQMLNGLQSDKIKTNVKTIKKLNEQHKIEEKRDNYHNMRKEIINILDNIKNKSAAAYYILNKVVEEGKLSKQEEGKEVNENKKITKLNLCENTVKKMITINSSNEQLVFEGIDEKYIKAEKILYQLNYLIEQVKKYTNFGNDDKNDAFILMCLRLWCMHSSKYKTTPDDLFINNLLENANKTYSHLIDSSGLIESSVVDVSQYSNPPLERQLSYDKKISQLINKDNEFDNKNVYQLQRQISDEIREEIKDDIVTNHEEEFQKLLTEIQNEIEKNTSSKVANVENEPAKTKQKSKKKNKS
jgi:hypothetical protein